MSSLVVFETENKKFDYRPVPESFEGYWKVGDTIKSTDGKEDCIIIEIILNTAVNRERLYQEKNYQDKTNKAVSKSKELKINKPKLKHIINWLYKELSNEKYSEHLKSEGLKIEDFNYGNG